MACRAVFAGHDVHGEIDHIDDFTVALPDAGRFDDDQVEASRFQEQDMIGEHLARREMLSARRDRAHINALRTQGIHANAIAEKRPARSSARGIDGQNRNTHIGIAT